MALLLAAWVVTAPAQVPLGRDRLACDDERLFQLFTPSSPQLGRYEVCTAPESLDLLAPREWPRRHELPLDAFGSAGTYARWGVRRLYGSSTARVARGWERHGDEFVSLTLISPYPDGTLQRLLPGTLVIRFIVPDGAWSGAAGKVDR